MYGYRLLEVLRSVDTNCPTSQYGVAESESSAPTRQPQRIPILTHWSINVNAKKVEQFSTMVSKKVVRR